MSVAVDAVREAFREFAVGNFVLPARQIFGDGTVLVMSAYHSPSGTAVVKKREEDRDRPRRGAGHPGHGDLDRRR